MTSTMLCKSQFARHAEIVRRRLLPGTGTVLVEEGDRVEPNDIVAQGELDGRIVAIDLATELNTSIRLAERSVVVTTGQTLQTDEVIATRGRLFKKQVLAPVAGAVQAVEDGYVFIRQAPTMLRLQAHIPGHVVETYPHRGVAIRVGGTLVGAVWGTGSDTHGTLVNLTRAPAERLTYEHVGLRYRGAILMGGVLDDARVVSRARQFQLAGLIVGSIAPSLIELVEQSGLTVLVTEGMGWLPMARPVYGTLADLHGRLAIMSGKSGINASGPELIVPFEAPRSSQALTVVRPMRPGMLVRLTRAPLLGMVGQIVSMPPTPQETIIGTLAEGANIRLVDGHQVFVPYVNMEALD